MADNIVTFQGQCVATDEIAGCHHLRTKLTFGADGSFGDVSSANPLPVSITAGGSSGGLTDTELRASPVPVSGAVTANVNGTVAVSGPLTDVQLRAQTVPISGNVGVTGTVAVTGAFFQATQPISGTITANAGSGTFAISAASLPLPSGASTETTLASVNTKTPALGQAAMVASSPVVIASNQSAVAVSLATAPTTPVTGTFWQTTQPISGTVTANAGTGTFAVSGTFWQATQPVSGTVTITPPTLTKGAQGSTGLSTQDLRDAGRSIVNAATAIAGVTAVTTEALLALNISRDGAATASATTIAVTSGKKLRIIGITAGVISTAAAVISARVCLRLNPNGAAAANSPIIAILPLSQQAAGLAQAGDTCVLMFSEAVEISGTMQVGLSQVASVATGTIWASLIAYEY